MTDFVKLTLDIRKRGVQDTIYLTAGDSNSRGVIVSLVADGTPFDIPSEAHVAMRIGPDQSLPADVIDGKIYHTFSLPVFETAGEHLCEVKVYEGNTILYSPKFSVIASEKLFEGDGELPEGGVSAVEQLISDTNDAKNRANSAADSAEIAVGRAEEAVESAREALENANEANKSVASAIKNANDAAQTAKNEADNAKQMADKAEASALQADTAAAYANEEAENAKKEAANASAAAGEAKDAAEGADDAALFATNKVAEIQQMLESGAFDGKDGIDGIDGKDGKDGNGIFVIENADANKLTEVGIYQCFGVKKNFTTQISNSETVVLLFVQKRVNSVGAQEVSQTVFFTGEDGRFHSYSRYFDNLVSVDWSEWSSKIFIPSGSVTEFEIADGVPVSKFANDKGYVTKTDIDGEVYEKIAAFEGADAVVEKQIDACKRIFVRMTLPLNTACDMFNIYAWHINKVIGRAEIPQASAYAKNQFSTFEVFKSFGWWRTRFGLWTTNTIQVNTDKGRDYDYFVKEDAEKPTAVQYQYINKISTTKAIPAGTKIEIWGVKLSAEELAAIPATLEELEL